MGTVGGAGQARAVLHLPHVAARRPVPRPARGRRRRQAQAGVLPRRGAPAVRRRQRGVPRRDRPHRPADPLQGRRRLLRDADAQGRAGGGAGAARQPRAARAARLHARRRQGAQGDGEHLPAVEDVRPGRAAAVDGHRRGGRHRAVRQRRADAGRLDAAAAARRRSMAPLDPAQQRGHVAASELLDDYGTPVDRDSAYERLLARVAPPEPEQAGAERRQEPSREQAEPERGRRGGLLSSPRVPELRAGRRRRGRARDRPLAVRHRPAAHEHPAAQQHPAPAAGPGSRPAGRPAQGRSSRTLPSTPACTASCACATCSSGKRTAGSAGRTPAATARATPATAASRSASVSP